MRAALAAALLLAAPFARAADVPVSLDPRLETLGIVQLLAGGEAPSGFRVPEGEYARRARAAFAKFKDHPAVALTAALPRVFDFRNRTDAVIRRAPLPGFGPRFFTPQYMILQAGGRAKFDAWLAALADFAAQAHVEDFVRDNASALEPALGEFRADVARRRYVEKLERYAGYPLDGRYEVYVAPFILRGSQENSVLRLEDGHYLIVSVVGPDVQGGKLTFRPEDFVATAGHELSHGLIDTLGDLHREKILGASGVYGRLPWPCYNDWLQCAKENFVRAIMLRLVDSELGPAAEERHLEQEGRAKWPYLEKTTELLKKYEGDRKRWPDLASFYPELIAVFPQDPPSASSSTAAAAGADAGPGPEWMYEETRPFSTPGQRALALEYLDRALAAARDPLLLRRRAAFRLLQGDSAGAEADASEAAALDPRDPAAFLARGLARSRLGRAAEARADFDAALAACPQAPAEAAIVCANARRMADGGAAPSGPDASIGPDPNVGPNPELGSRPDGASGVEPAKTRAPSTVDYEFVVDPRIELLAAAVSLAGPGGAPAPASFAGLKDHPAVRRLKAALDRGVSEIAPAQLLLTVGPPPALKENGPPPSGLAGPFGGEADAESFLSELRDFAAAGGWEKEWARRKAENADLVRRAQDETRRTLSPEAVESWFNVRFKDRYRFIISADLPSTFACNFADDEGGRRVEIRLRSVMGWRDKNAYFSFDDFAGSVAHELTHTITDPLLLARTAQLAAFSSLMTPGCTDSWTGCVLEHVNIAGTLRALRLESGEAAYQATLKHYAARGFPYLPALCERFAEFEDPAVKARGFKAFLPRVFDVLSASLRAKFRTQAHANIAAAAASNAAAPEPFSEEFGSDPRLELVSELHRLAGSAERRAKEGAAAPGYAARLDARFARFSGHPAVALTARLEAAAGEPGLPADLIVHLSTTPELALRTQVPAGYREAAGGEAALSAWFDAVRDFARESGFFGFLAGEEAANAALSREARAEAGRALPPSAVAEYLGRPLAGRRAYALSPLYPSSYPARLAVFGDGAAAIVRPRAAKPGPHGEARFGLDVDEGSTAQELVYDEASRLVPGVPGAAGSAGGLAEACADRRGADWPTCEREHLAAAVLLRARRAAGGDSADARSRADRDARTLPYLPALLERLAVYETSRSSYPALADYWPEAEKAFGPAARAAPATAEEVADAADFGVDPRVELAAVLLRLGGAGAGAEALNEEARLADERFAPFAAHPAVARVKSLSRGAAAGQTPLRLVLALGDPPELAERGLPPEPWLSAAGGPAGFRAFAADLRSFAKDSRFAEFYDASRPRHDASVAEARAEAVRETSPRAARAYLGVAPPRMSFLLTALLPASYGTDFAVKTETGSAVWRIWPAADGLGPARFRLDSFGDSVAHELIHGVTDALVPERFAPGGPVPRGCNDENAEPSWRACAQEHLVYAVTLRLLAADAGEEAAKIQAASYAERGYPRLPRLLDLLKEYERNRDRFPTLAGFAPRLLSAFGSADADREAARAARASAFMVKGVAAFMAGDVPGATALLRRARALAPEDPEISLNLGVCLDKAGDGAGALAAYSRAAAGALSGGQRRWEIAAAALSSRADLRIRQGRRGEARDDLAKAVDIVPADWPGRAELRARWAALAP